MVEAVPGERARGGPRQKQRFRGLGEDPFPVVRTEKQSGLRMLPKVHLGIRAAVLDRISVLVENTRCTVYSIKLSKI